MNKIFRICLVYAVTVFSACPVVVAQQKDFQFRPSVGADVEVIKNLKVSFTEELRLKENCSQLERQISDLGLSYKFSKHFRVALYYRVERKWENVDNYVWRQGFYGDVAVKYNKGPFSLGYRLRLQSSKIEFNNVEDKMMASLVNRHKFSLDYNIPDLPLTPFIEEELFIKSMDRSMYLSNFRSWIGLTWSPGKMHEFSLKYGIDQERMVKDPLRAYILAFNYVVKIKL